MPMRQLELHPSQIELATHRHRDAAQIATEVGLEREDAPVSVATHGASS